MKEIKWLAENIREELEDAEKYAKAAIKYKDTDRSLSMALADLAKQELGHSEVLHTHAVKIIKEHKENGAEPPAAMQAVWDWEHEHMIERTSKIKHLLDMGR
jgi:DNA-binding HxlR family transcriptional regulator